MSLKNYYKELEGMSEDKVLLKLDEIADEMKQNVLSAPSDWYARERVIYVSADGDDGNDGLSPEKPIKTLAKVCEIIREQDTFLFRRGDMFRGKVIIPPEAVGVTFSAYGQGEKPIINASYLDYADEKYWEETPYENVWKCTEKLHNAGIIHFNATYKCGEYDGLAGDLQILGGTKDFEGEKDLKCDMQFWSDLATDTVYLYCADGNPGKAYTHIDIGTRGDTIRTRAPMFTADNLHIMHTGSHGVAGHGTQLTVQNCVFDWLGGSILEGYRGVNTIRYGNGVEVGSANGYHVRNNWLYQIYDTGITHQTSPGANCDVHQYNITYLDNLVEFCYWSLEMYNANDEHYHDIRNVYMSGNMCRFGGFGWGCRKRVHGAPMFSSAYCCPDVRDFLVENNIFDRCDGTMISLWDANDEKNLGNARIVFRSNVYVQPKDVFFMNVKGKKFNFDDNVRESLGEYIHDKTATVVPTSSFHMEMK